MPSPSYSADVRAEIKRYMTASATAYLQELTLRYFGDNAASPAARQILLESLTDALRAVTEDDPTAQAMLRAFALELLGAAQG